MQKPYGERDFVRALVPVLIGRLPDPLAPTESDMLQVAKAAGRWAELLVDLRVFGAMGNFLLDHDGPAWNQAADADD